jgi:hypothetical protein
MRRRLTFAGSKSHFQFPPQALGLLFESLVLFPQSLDLSLGPV